MVAPVPPRVGDVVLVPMIYREGIRHDGWDGKGTIEAMSWDGTAVVRCRMVNGTILRLRIPINQLVRSRVPPEPITFPDR